MRTNTIRLGLASAMVAGLAAVLLSVPRDTAALQQVPAAAPPAPPTEGTPPTEGGVEKFNFPEDRDTSLKFEAVLEYLANKTIDWKVVSELVQKLLNAKSDYFYKYPNGDKAGLRVSVKEEVNRIIGTFPKDGRDFYEQTFGAEADSELKAAKAAGYDAGLLAAVSQKYFHTRAGAEASVLLARVHLELGNYPQAAYGFRRLLARPDADAVLDTRALVQALVAFKRGGDGRRPEEINLLWDRIEKKYPRDGLLFGNRAFTFDRLKAEVDANVELVAGAGADATVSMRGGNLTRNGFADAGAPFLDPVIRADVPRTTNETSKRAGEKIAKTINDAYSSARNEKRKVYLPAAFPLTAPGLILYRGYDGVYARHTKEGAKPDGTRFHVGEVAWFSPSRGAVQAVMTGDDEAARGIKSQTDQWWAYWQQNMPSMLFENSLIGSLSHDGRLAYGVDDLGVLPSPFQQGYNDGGWNPNGGAAPNTPKDMQDYNRLYALDMATEGSAAWWIGGLGPDAKPEDEAKLATADKLAENSYFLGPPLPVNGKLYVLLEKAGHLKMACLDPNKLTPLPPATHRSPVAPELVWVQNLGRTNTPLRQDPLRRMQASFLASADGIVVCPTNAGAVIAVDINARSLLWAHTYGAGGKADDGTPRMQQMGRVRGGGVAIQPLPNERWRSAAPVIAHGRVVLSAYDADTIQCVDLRTGKVFWSEKRREDDMYVGGVIGQTVVVVGRHSVRGLKLVGDKPDPKTGREQAAAAWPDLKTGTPTGHGSAGKDGLYYLPVYGDPDRPEATTVSVWAVNAETGARVSRTEYRRKEAAEAGSLSDDPQQLLGNIVFHDGLMVSQSAIKVSAFALIGAKRREMDALLAKNPDDPDGLTSRGELSLDEGRYEEAVADLKRAERNQPSETTARTIRQKLYVTYTEILRADFPAGEKLLEEYRRLCESPAEAEEGAADRERRADERTRRLGLYYCLVAKGREKQGRLADAYDHYRAYAALGEQGRLLPVPEDPNTRALPAVWASGRIDAMMRAATDPAARKPLDAKVQEEWRAVRTGDDLARLENFARTFGPYFAAGRDAQSLLAERLILSTDDGDRRKAQGLLLNLIAQADDTPAGRQAAARATEALARLLTGRNLMDDAVGLYARLGGPFADVAVRDGRTGADLYADLVTDKRLLPYLEPAQPVRAKKYKVEATSNQNNGQVRPISYTLAPDGDLLPYLKRHRISLDIDPNNGNNCVLAVTDRVTGDSAGKFTISNVQPYQMWNSGSGAAPLRVVQACGHLLLVNVGNWVYCFDLTQRGATPSQLKELWKVDLFGQTSPVLGQQPLQSEGSDNGDVVFRSHDGWAFRLGRSAVLQPSYACVLTRDGMVVKDPYTGTELWRRANVSGRASVYGDARHIYLVEAGVARVLRAADGAAVEGVPNFAALATGPNRLANFGRHVLRDEPKTDAAARRLRLYDILTGRDVWSVDLPAEAAVMRSIDPEFCGAVTGDGRMTVYAARTGKVVLDAAVDKKNLAEHVRPGGKFALTTPVLLADGERFYVVLNREDKGPGGTTYWGGTAVRMVNVNGACYAFDRGTGRRLWYTDDHLLRQNLCVERFDEMPCLFASNPQYTDSDTPNRGAQYAHRLVAIDKRTGLAVLGKDVQQAQGAFYSLSHNPRDGSFEFWQHQLSVRIKADESAKPNEPRK